MRRKKQVDPTIFDPDAPPLMPVRHIHEGCSKGGDKTLIVTRVQDGWVYHCHRCGLHGLQRLDGSPPATVAKFAAELLAPPKPSIGEVNLPPRSEPTPVVKELATVWLQKYGITEDDFLYYKLYYSSGRLVFPLYDDRGEPVFWQSRGFRSDEPKWINQKAFGRGDIFFWGGLLGTNYVVLVEDMISAIRVGRQFDCAALLGSYIPDHLILQLVRKYAGIILWLDNDKSGYCVGKIRRYRTIGLPVSGIFTTGDPKTYTDEDIRKFVGEVMFENNSGATEIL